MVNSGWLDFYDDEELFDRAFCLSKEFFMIETDEHSDSSEDHDGCKQIEHYNPMYLEPETMEIFCSCVEQFDLGGREIAGLLSEHFCSADFEEISETHEVMVFSA